MTTNFNHDRPVYPNLARGMVLTGIDQLWVADITYIRLETEFVYLAVVLGAWRRRVPRSSIFWSAYLSRGCGGGREGCDVAVELWVAVSGGKTLAHRRFRVGGYAGFSGDVPRNDSVTPRPSSRAWR